MKKLLLAGAFILLMAGCETQNNGAKTAKVQPITLTETELKEVGENSNAAAQVLVRKAVLSEMKGVKYTEEEKKELDEIKKNIEIEYFLNKKAMETVKVDDMEVLQVYQNNAEKLKDADIVQVLPQLKEQMILQRREESKVNYMNSLVEKYNLNDEIKKHFPETIKAEENKATDKVTEKAPEKPAKKDTKKSSKK